MPSTVAPIPARTAITQEGNPITEFFRLRWEEVRTAFGLLQTVANPATSSVQSASLSATTIYTIPSGQGGKYLVMWGMQRTVVDGVASSLQATITWTQNGITKSHVGRLMNTDSLAADPTDSPIMIDADASSNIQIAIAYTSTTPGTMQYTYDAAASRLA